VRIAVLGAGMVGRAMVFDLCRQDDVVEVLVADCDVERARDVAERYGAGKARGVGLDVTDVPTRLAVTNRCTWGELRFHNANAICVGPPRPTGSGRPRSPAFRGTVSPSERPGPPTLRGTASRPSERGRVGLRERGLRQTSMSPRRF